MKRMFMMAVMHVRSPIRGMMTIVFDLICMVRVESTAVSFTQTQGQKEGSLLSL